MHALARVGRVAGDPRYLHWAMELAATAYDDFTYVPDTGGQRRMVWKMSIDLSRPLVDTMGQHDPLDGLVTCVDLRTAAKAWDEIPPLDLDAQIAGLAAMCKDARLAATDPLGTGGLLTAARTLAHLTAAGVAGFGDLLETLLEQALPGLERQAANRDALSMPPDYRLAFREFGLSIGLRAVQRTRDLLAQRPDAFDSVPSLRSHLKRLMRHVPLIETIERFWLDPANRKSATWMEHQDINAVMLATSLTAHGFLSI